MRDIGLHRKNAGQTAERDHRPKNPKYCSVLLLPLIRFIFSFRMFQLRPNSIIFVSFAVSSSMHFCLCVTSSAMRLEILQASFVNV